MSDAHIPSTLGAQSATEASHRPPFQRRRRAKRAPRVLQRTHTDHASSAGGEQSDPHAFSQRTHNDHPSCAGGRAKRAPRGLQGTHTKHLPSAESPTNFPKRTCQTPFGRRRAPRIFRPACIKHPSSACGVRSEPNAFSKAHTSNHPSSAGSEREEPHAFSKRTPTDHALNAGSRANRVPSLAQRTHTNHPSLCQSASTAMQFLNISWKPFLAVQLNWLSFRIKRERFDDVNTL